MMALSLERNRNIFIHLLFNMKSRNLVQENNWENVQCHV